MNEDLAEEARVRSLRLVAEAILKAAGDEDIPAEIRTRLGDVALDVLIELRSGPIGPERGIQLQKILAAAAIDELGEPF